MEVSSYPFKPANDPEMASLSFYLHSLNKNELAAWCSTNTIDKEGMVYLRNLMATYEYYEHAAAIRDMIDPKLRSKLDKLP